MTRVASVAVRLLPALLLGAVGFVLGPLLLQWLGLSGTAAFGVGVGATVGAPAVGAVWILLRRRRARRDRPSPEGAAPAPAAASPARPQPRPASGPASEEDGVTLDGRWSVTISTPLGRQKGELDLHVDGESLTGTAHVLGGSVPIADGTAVGAELRFTIRVTTPLPMTLDFRLVVDGDTVDGTVAADPIGEQRVVGERA